LEILSNGKGVLIIRDIPTLTNPGLPLTKWDSNPSSSATGETPHQYRSRAQVEKAKHLLILTDLSITDVCMAMGYSSLGSFSALFSRRVGMSPSEFQRRYRPVSAPEPQLPASLIPGCLSLMTGISEKEQFSRRQPVDETDRV